MEPTNHPFRKEIYLPNLHAYVQHVNLQGCKYVGVTFFGLRHFSTTSMICACTNMWRRFVVVKPLWRCDAGHSLADRKAWWPGVGRVVLLVAVVKRI